MKVLWISASNSAIAFWRIEQIAKYFFENYRENSPIGKPVFPHVEYFLNPDSNISWDHFVQYKDQNDSAEVIYNALESAFKHFDIIICQALGYSPGLNRLIELKNKYKKTLLMEIDDCFDEFNPSNFSQAALKDHFNVQAKQATISDGIITTNFYLGRKLSKYNSNIYVLPNAINRYFLNSKNKLKKRDRVDYAFVGAGSHDEDLKIAYRAMVPLMDAGYKFGIYYGSFRPDWMKEHENLIFENWSYHISEFYDHLKSIDCGMFFAPLRDTEFNRCKSNVKIIESQICGKRIICSNVGPFKSHNKNYLTSNDTDDWVNIFKKHKDNKKKTILSKKHKIEKYSDDFLKYLNKMVK